MDDKFKEEIRDVLEKGLRGTNLCYNFHGKDDLLEISSFSNYKFNVRLAYSIADFPDIESFEQRLREDLARMGIKEEQQEKEEEQQEQIKPDEEQGIKHDKGKPELSLIDQGFLFEMGRILTEGAKRYGRNNWRLLDSERTYNAALRHAHKCTETELIENNEDFGGSHETYAAIELMFTYCIKRDKKEV